MAATVNSIVFDLGTTAIKAAICSENQPFKRIFSQPAPKISIHNGQYVSDAMAYLATVEQLLEKCYRYCQTSPLLGLCYQRSSFVIWDSQSGLSVTPLISWQDNRGDSSCKKLQENNSLIRQLTGLPLTAYYFAPKLHALLLQQPELLQGLLNNNLCVGTLDSFLIWHWTEGNQYLTDVSMAARTQLMDIHTRQWSESLADIFKIPLQVLPEICPSNGLNIELKNGAVLMASVADQSAALLANIEKDDSEVLVNLGTGGFVIRYQPENSTNETMGYLSTLIYQDSHNVNYMAIEGTLNSITEALKPYPFRACTIEDLAEFMDIYCLAEPSGIGAPFFRPDIGLEFSKPIAHLTPTQIASLLLEGIIFRVALILEQYNYPSEISRVYLSGGLSVLPCLQQGIALCSAAPVFKICQEHSGLLGIATLANDLKPASFRLSEPILPINKCHGLIIKYQQWKIWFNQIIND